MRRLHQRDIAVFDHPPDGLCQKVTRRHVVTVKNRDQIPVRHFESVIDIARFSMVMDFTLDITSPH